MKKVYYLSNCSTCKRIFSELGIGQEFEYQDIKFKPITAVQIDEMHSRAGTYEALFSRKARKYRELGLAELDLTEKDYRSYILEEYTFLKRPVFLIEDKIFIGNASKNIAEIKAAL